MNLTKESLECLNYQNYLNDDIVDFYLQYVSFCYLILSNFHNFHFTIFIYLFRYIKDRLITDNVAKKTYIFTSFFFSKMLETKNCTTDKK